MSIEIPDYVGALKHKKARKIIRFLAENGGSATYKEIEEATKFTSSVIRHHLDRAELEFHVIQKRKRRSPYALAHRSPLCFLFSEDRKIAYFGLLGKGGTGIKDPETVTAKEILEQREGFNLEIVHVLTTSSGRQSWSQDQRLYEINPRWTICSDQEVTSVETIRKKMLKEVIEALRDHLVVMDCTSLNKPATIAYYKIASELMLPLIYVSEEKKSLSWIISKEDIMNEMSFDSELGA